MLLDEGQPGRVNERAAYLQRPEQLHVLPRVRLGLRAAPQMMVQEVQREGLMGQDRTEGQAGKPVLEPIRLNHVRPLAVPIEPDRLLALGPAAPDELRPLAAAEIQDRLA